MSNSDTAKAYGMPVRIRADTYGTLKDMAKTYGITMSTTLDMLSECWVLAGERARASALRSIEYNPRGEGGEVARHRRRADAITGGRGEKRGGK